MRKAFLLALSLLPWGSAMAVASSCVEPTCIEYPADAGALNVRDFGAKGDGIADDTAAINAALTASGGDTGGLPWQDRIVYLPNGTYLVTGQILKRYANGKFASGSILVGQSEARTIIRLADNADGFGDPAHHKGVIFTTSKLLDGSPTSGGKDYTGKGEGNDAYENFVENMTIDVGSGNLGAVGIDYLASNIGAIRHVTVRAPAGGGLTGIALVRKWPGPLLLDHVTVDGFTMGIDVANTEYGVTFDTVTLKNQRETGLRNDHNVVSAHNLTIEGAPQPVINKSHDGLVVIDNGWISRPKDTGDGDAIQNAGYLNLRDLKVKHYASVSGMPVSNAPVDGVFDGTNRIAPSKQSWSLPEEEAPIVPGKPIGQWVGVVPPASAGADSTTAIRKAFASGADTIYFPHAHYLISENIAVPPTVHHIVGMMSMIGAVKGQGPSFRRDEGMFRIQNSTGPVVIEHVAFDHSDLGDQVGIEADGSQPLVLRDVVGAGLTTLKRPADGGKVFVEDTCCGAMEIHGPAGVWVRQLNTEGGGSRVIVDGAPLWVLGLKTEGDCVAIDNRQGALTEVMGGLIYPVRKTNPDIPAFRNHDSRMYLSYAEEAFAKDAVYQTQVENFADGQADQIEGSSLPLRTIGRMQPGVDVK
jgi:hypothetical protein